MYGELEVVVDAQAVLGEGPSWDAATGTLLWVDIMAKALHIYNPDTGEDQSIPVGAYVGAAVPSVRGDVILALEKGFARVDRETGVVTQMVDVDERVRDNRFNDGKCDPAGRFWAGTMNTAERAPYRGTLYCLTTDYQCTPMIAPVTTSNGLTWSPDGKTMYYIDTPTNRVVAYDYNQATAHISRPRIVVEIPAGHGGPDGMTSDEEGMLWIAHWDGFEVSRWNPETGEQIGSIMVPVQRPTSCCFGGPDLTDLYITSASVGLSPGALAAQRHAGNVFRVRTGIKGAPTYAFGG